MILIFCNEKAINPIVFREMIMIFITLLRKTFRSKKVRKVKYILFIKLYATGKAFSFIHVSV